MTSHNGSDNTLTHESPRPRRARGLIAGGVAGAFVVTGAVVGVHLVRDDAAQPPATAARVATATPTASAATSPAKAKAKAKASATAAKPKPTSAAKPAAKATAKATATATAKSAAKATAKATARAKASSEVRSARSAMTASRSKARVAKKAVNESPRETGRRLAAAKGWGGSQFSCLDKLWTKESDWSVDADNPTSSAYGIPQALPGNKMASAGSGWRHDPGTQISWGLGYIDDVYGTPCEAWSHSRANNWY